MSTAADLDLAILDANQLRRNAALEKHRDPMRRLEAHNTRIQHHNGALIEAVIEAREAGATWTEIGEVLGVSKQAILQRFGDRGRYPVDEIIEKRAKSKKRRKR